MWGREALAATKGALLCPRNVSSLVGLGFNIAIDTAVVLVDACQLRCTNAVSNVLLQSPHLTIHGILDVRRDLTAS